MTNENDELAELPRLERLLVNIGHLERALGDYSEWDTSEVLRETADQLQRLREHAWPRWIELGGAG
jgi:hypothetical protein